MWTVGEFEIELQSHPLVFRSQKFSKGDFAYQFQMAIIDMVRDKYVTDEAYKMNLDQDVRIINKTQMWEDNLVSLYEREKLLRDLDLKGLSQYEIVENYLDPHFIVLSKKYSDHIFIDIDEFDKIKLTSIDVFTIQENVPFPVYVPGFPQLTTHNSIDFGHKMEKRKLN